MRIIVRNCKECPLRTLEDSFLENFYYCKAMGNVKGEISGDHLVSGDCPFKGKIFEIQVE